MKQPCLPLPAMQAATTKSTKWLNIAQPRMFYPPKITGCTVPSGALPTLRSDLLYCNVCIKTISSFMLNVCSALAPPPRHQHLRCFHYTTHYSTNFLCFFQMQRWLPRRSMVSSNVLKCLSVNYIRSCPTFCRSYWKSHGLVTGGQYNSHEGCQPYEIQSCDHHVNGMYTAYYIVLALAKCEVYSRSPDLQP